MFRRVTSVGSTDQLISVPGTYRCCVLGRLAGIGTKLRSGDMYLTLPWRICSMTSSILVTTVVYIRFPVPKFSRSFLPSTEPPFPFVPPSLSPHCVITRHKTFLCIMKGSFFAPRPFLQLAHPYLLSPTVRT